MIHRLFPCGTSLVGVRTQNTDEGEDDGHDDIAPKCRGEECSHDPSVCLLRTILFPEGFQENETCGEIPLTVRENPPEEARDKKKGAGEDRQQE